MPAFKLPLFKRTIGLYRKYKCALLEIGGVGVYVQYDNDDELAPNLLRTCNIGIGEDYGYIEADDARSAIEVFFTEWDGAKMGTKAKALEINRWKPILQYPLCSRLVEIDGWQRCKYPYDEDEEPCDCVLDGADPPEDCPIDQFTGNVRKKVGIFQQLVVVKPYGEFLVVCSDPSYTKIDNRVVRCYC